MKHPTRISRTLRFLVPVALGAVVLAPVPAAPAVAAPRLASTMGVYPGFDDGARFAAHERSLKADLAWAVQMSGRESPGAMRSSVWGAGAETRCVPLEGVQSRQSGDDDPAGVRKPNRQDNG